MERLIKYFIIHSLKSILKINSIDYFAKISLKHFYGSFQKIK